MYQALHYLQCQQIWHITSTYPLWWCLMSRSMSPMCRMGGEGVGSGLGGVCRLVAMVLMLSGLDVANRWCPGWPGWCGWCGWGWGCPWWGACGWKACGWWGWASPFNLSGGVNVPGIIWWPPVSEKKNVIFNLCSTISYKIHRCINGLVQDCNISSALAMEILQSCTNPSIFSFSVIFQHWDDAGSWNLSSWRTRTPFFHILSCLLLSGIWLAVRAT